MPAVTITQDILNKSPGGIHAKFVDLGDCGMKIYLSERARNAQFNNQTVLHELGLAVDCWDCFDFDGPNGERLYAFYTDKAEVYSSNTYINLDDSEGSAYCSRFYRCIEDLRSLLNDKGIDWTDYHIGNCGFDSAGDPVVIDCDFFFDEHNRFEYVGCTTPEQW